MNIQTSEHLDKLKLNGIKHYSNLHFICCSACSTLENKSFTDHQCNDTYRSCVVYVDDKEAMTIPCTRERSYDFAHGENDNQSEIVLDSGFRVRFLMSCIESLNTIYNRLFSWTPTTIMYCIIVHFKRLFIAALWACRRLRYAK